MAVGAVAAYRCVLPFGVAMLFGDLDAWFPLLYGALLLRVLPGASQRAKVAAGAAAAVSDRQAPPCAAAALGRRHAIPGARGRAGAGARQRRS